MFRFENADYFYLFGILPVVVAIWYYSKYQLQQRINAFGNDQLINRLRKGKVKNISGLLLLLLTLSLLILASVNPQYGLKKEKMKVEKSDIFIALDISASMNATDISPSRLEKSKRFVQQLIEARKGDQLGLIYFAGGAYLQMPLTTDYAAAELFARSATTDMAGTQGTAVGEAIDLAMRSIKEKNQRALIIISDGEDHDSDAVKMALKAADNGWNIFTVGAGTVEGGFVPVLNEGREEYKMDEEGNPIKSALNQDLLKDIAENGKGTFYLLENDAETIISDINTQLDKMQKRAVEIKSFTEYRSFYQYFLCGAVILVLINFFTISGRLKSEKA